MTEATPDTCPYCGRVGGLDEADDGRLKCRLCGWRAEEKMTEATPRTVRVRIAVAIEDDGRWWAHGYAGDSDRELIEGVSDGPNCAVYFIEATIPIPEPLVIEADKVEAAE